MGRMKGEQLTLDPGDGFTLIETAWQRRNATNELRWMGCPVETRGRGKTRFYRQNDGKAYLVVKLTAPGRMSFRLYLLQGGTVNVSALATVLPVQVQPRLSRTGVQKPNGAQEKPTYRRAK